MSGLGANTNACAKATRRRGRSGNRESDRPGYGDHGGRQRSARAVQRGRPREARLAELGAKKVTRGLAEANRDRRPIVALFTECHELFGHDQCSELAAELATKTAKRARKTTITLLFDTQSSRKEAIPPKLVELVSVNCCFYVKTWRSNDGFLGDESFAAGIRATELRPGRDRGTSVITGVSDAQFKLLRWYFVEVDDDTGFKSELLELVVARSERKGKYDDQREDTDDADGQDESIPPTTARPGYFCGVASADDPSGLVQGNGSFGARGWRGLYSLAWGQPVLVDANIQVALALVITCACRATPTADGLTGPESYPG